MFAGCDAIGAMRAAMALLFITPLSFEDGDARRTAQALIVSDAASSYECALRFATSSQRCVG